MTMERWIRSHILDVAAVLSLLAAIGVAVIGFRLQPRMGLHAEPSVLTLHQAVYMADLVVVGTPRENGTTRMAVTKDGWEKEALIPSPFDTPYTNFAIRVEEVLKAPAGFDGQEITLRVLGDDSVAMESDANMLSEIVDGARYIFFLKSPHVDKKSWRLVDNVHILPVEGGKVQPNPRILKWNVDSIRTATDMAAFRKKVAGFVHVMPPISPEIAVPETGAPRTPPVTPVQPGGTLPGGEG